MTSYCSNEKLCNRTGLIENEDFASWNNFISQTLWNSVVLRGKIVQNNFFEYYLRNRPLKYSKLYSHSQNMIEIKKHLFLENSQKFIFHSHIACSVKVFFQKILWYSSELQFWEHFTVFQLFSLHRIVCKKWGYDELCDKKKTPLIWANLFLFKDLYQRAQGPRELKHASFHRRDFSQENTYWVEGAI